MYLCPGSRFLLVVGVFVQLIGLLLLIDLVEAVHLEELEVLQLGHLGQPGPTGPAVSHHTPQSGVVLHAMYLNGVVHDVTACYVNYGSDIHTKEFAEETHSKGSVPSSQSRSPSSIDAKHNAHLDR